jgi:Protein of unknown function (DUF3500)
MHRRLWSLAIFLAACGDDGTSTDIDASVSTVDCAAATTQIEKAICQTQGFLATLSATELASTQLALTDTTARTRWSNLPGQNRPGPTMGELGATSQAAALALMGTLLSADGMEDLTGVRAADDYLAANGGGSQYGAAGYHIAVFGTPAITGTWEVMFGGHHMAWNITFIDGVAHPIPNHLGVEPKSAFTVNGESYSPMIAEGAALLAVFTSLDSTALASAHLSGTFSDVVVGPAEYGTGSSAAAKAKFPAATNRTGVLVSSLSTTQQALVSAAIEQWVDDFDAETAATLRTAYTSSAAYQDTYVAWGGTGIDVDVSGTYMRIDGPRVWIEVSCQGGVVVRNATHYHSIYRDKTDDYGGTL